MITVFSDVTQCSLVKTTRRNIPENSAIYNWNISAKHVPQLATETGSTERPERSADVSKDELTAVNQTKFPDFILFIQNLDLLFLDGVQ